MEDLVLYLILGLISAVVIYFLTYAYWSHQYWITYGFEQIQPHLFYGNLKPYLRHNLDFGTVLKNYYKESEGLKYVGLYMIYKPALLLRDSQVIQQFLQTNFMNFSTRSLYSAKEKCPLLDNMYQRSGVEWKEEREMVAKAFSQENIADLYDTIIVTRALERYLDGLSDCAANAININKLIERHLYNVMAWLIYGVHVDTISYSEESFRMTGIEVFRPKFVDKILFLRDFVVPVKWEWLLRLLNFRRHSKKVEDFYISLTKHSLGRREFHPKEWNINKDYMQYLMKIRNRGYLFDDERREPIRVDVGGKKHLSLEEVSSQAFLAFSSGFPSILSTIDFFMFEVAKNPTIQNKLSVEIEDMFERTEGNPEYADIVQMTYLDACLNETLRKYPPVQYLVRYCTSEFRMKRENYLIEKGMPIFISILGIHHDPKYYPNPMEFDPDRFTMEAFTQRPPLSFLPFGNGPKHCIGMELAKAILKTHLVFMLSKYVVSVGPKMKDREINFDVNYLSEVHRINLCFGQRMKLSPSEEDEDE